jgi:AraC-like DNA-binding protein
MSEDRKDNASASNRIQFCRYPPGLPLSPFVRNFWTARRANALGASTHQRIVPDGCIDIIFVRRSPTADYRAYVVGTMTKPIFEHLTDQPDYIGIRFAPGGFGYFFKMPPSDLTDQIVALEDPSILAVAAEQIAETDDTQTRLDLLEKHLRGQFTSERRNPMIEQTVATIAARRGNVTIAELARRAAWSPRHLRRTFSASIGVGPKTFCRIVRFKSALRALRHRRRPDLLGVALDAGYYDQAHLIHEFNSFYGASPSAVSKDHRP